MHTYMHTCMHTYTHTYIQIHRQTQDTCIQTYSRICIHTHFHTYCDHQQDSKGERRGEEPPQLLCDDKLNAQLVRDNTNHTTMMIEVY